MAKKRNIALVINDLKGNGAERVAITLASGFREAGHSASIVCFKRHIELPIPKTIPVFIFSEKRFRWIPRSIRGRLVAPWLDRFIRRKVGIPHLVLSNLMPSDRILAYSKLPNTRFIIHSTTQREVANYFPQNLKREIKERRKLYLKKPSICVSKGVEKDLRELLGTLTVHDIRTIYNPVDVEYITESANSTPPDIIPNAIVHIGKFNKAKRQDRLVRAYHAANCPYPLVFIGQGPLLEKTSVLVTELGLDGRVHFLGFRKNPYTYIKAARLLVLCSDFEGLGVVLLEAMCLNTPAISSNCPSGPSEVLPSMNLFNTHDLEGMVKVLKQASENPAAYTLPLNKNFSKQTAVRKYLGLLQVEQ